MADEIANLKQRLAATEAARDALVIGPQVDAALAAFGVAAPFRVAARALWLEKTLELVDGEVFHGNRAIGQVIEAWAATPEGRAFTTVPASAKPTKLGKGASAKKRSEMSKAERAAFCAEHGVAAYEALPK